MPRPRLHVVRAAAAIVAVGLALLAAPVLLVAALPPPPDLLVAASPLLAAVPPAADDVGGLIPSLPATAPAWVVALVTSLGMVLQTWSRHSMASRYKQGTDARVESIEKTVHELAASAASIGPRIEELHRFLTVQDPDDGSTSSRLRVLQASLTELARLLTSSEQRRATLETQIGASIAQQADILSALRADQASLRARVDALEETHSRRAPRGGRREAG